MAKFTVSIPLDLEWRGNEISGAADGWGASLTRDQVNAAGFAVFLSAQANIANADIAVDFIRATVNYTPGAGPTERAHFVSWIQNDIG